MAEIQQSLPVRVTLLLLSVDAMASPSTRHKKLGPLKVLECECIEKQS